MDLPLLRRKLTHGTVSYAASVMKHPSYKLLRSGRDSFRQTELDGDNGFGRCVGLAAHGFFKDENMPNTYRCFCCGLELAARDSSFLKELCSYDVHKMKNTSVGCFCAYWEIFKHFKTTDVEITEQIDHASAHGLLGYENCKPIAVWFKCHNKRLVTGDVSLWDTILNNQNRGDDVDVHAELNTHGNSHGTGWRNRLGVFNSDQNNGNQSSIDEVDGFNPSIDAMDRATRSPVLDTSTLLACPFCTQVLSFRRVG